MSANGICIREDNLLNLRFDAPALPRDAVAVHIDLVGKRQLPTIGKTAVQHIGQCPADPFADMGHIGRGPQRQRQDFASAGRYETGVFFAKAEALIDLSDTHKGGEAATFAGVQFEAGKLPFEAGLGARHRSGDLNQYLFGVAASETTASRAGFAPGSTTTGFASLTGVYLLRDSIAVVGDITFEDLGGMDASPLVEKSSKTSVTLGLLYQF